MPQLEFQPTLMFFVREMQNSSASLSNWAPYLSVGPTCPKAAAHPNVPTRFMGKHEIPMTSSALQAAPAAAKLPSLPLVAPFLELVNTYEDFVIKYLKCKLNLIKSFTYFTKSYVN